MTVLVPPSTTTSAATGVLDLDAGAPIPEVVEVPELGARVLVRLAGRPVGTVDLPGTPSRRIPAADLAATIWAGLGSVLDRRMVELDQPLEAPLDEGGLGVAPAEPVPDVARSVTVVVATRDRPDTLARSLESIFAARPAPAALVVVDNAPSDDATRELVAARYGDDPRVTYVREPRPGLGRAHNAALPHVATDHVAITDDDVVVDPGWVGAIAAAFAAEPTAACVTGLIAPAELRTREQWWVERSTGFDKGYVRRVRTLGGAGESRLFPYDAGTLGSGANMAFTTSFLTEIGGFDPALGAGTTALGGDDLAALHQVVARGRTLVYEPAAVVFHRHHANLPALERQAYGYGAGLTAYLAATVARRPRAALEVLARLLPGAVHVGAGSSPLNARRPADYPKALVRRERLGMLVGPVRYARQRWLDRKAAP